MSTGDYSVVIDVDEEGDLGDLEFNQDLEFHQSNFTTDQASGKIPSDDTRSGGFFGGSRSSRPGTGGSGGKRFLWSLDFYAQFFDVDTDVVLKRCWAAIFPRADFLDVLEGNADLYGPLWITTTVVLILFLSSTIAGYFATANSKEHYQYKFDLLSGAAGLMYGYTGIVPVALWGVLKWYGSESANLLECMSLYGYANCVWVFVAIASASPIALLNWIFVIIGFGVSALFLYRNLKPVISATDGKTSGMLLIAVVVLHAGLSLAIKILFFHHTSPLAPSPPPLDTPPPIPTNTMSATPIVSPTSFMFY